MSPGRVGSLVAVVFARFYPEAKKVNYKFVVMLLFALTSAVVADTVELRSGQTLQGRVTAFEKGKFTFRPDNGEEQTLRASAILSIDFAQKLAAGRVNRPMNNPPPAAAKEEQPTAALSGTELDAWKLARSHVMSRHRENWMPHNALPIRDAIRSTVAGDYLVAIPVATIPEAGFAQQYGIFLVQVTQFQSALRVDGDTFQQTNGPFVPRR